MLEFLICSQVGCQSVLMLAGTSPWVQWLVIACTLPAVPPPSPAASLTRTYASRPLLEVPKKRPKRASKDHQALLDILDTYGGVSMVGNVCKRLSTWLVGFPPLFGRRWVVGGGEDFLTLCCNRGEERIERGRRRSERAVVSKGVVSSKTWGWHNGSMFCPFGSRYGDERPPGASWLCQYSAEDCHGLVCRENLKCVTVKTFPPSKLCLCSAS